MKIIFLDIDGVLNTVEKQDDDCFLDGYILNRTLVGRLNKLITDTGASVVISSTWRKLLTADDIQIMLDFAGYVGTICGMTENSSHGVRGVEINSWLRSRRDSITNYIILDDDSDMMLNQAPHFFNTDINFGLTDKIVYKATRFLNGCII